MRYLLMHRDVEVAALDMDEWSGDIEGMAAVHDPEHLPYGTAVDGVAELRLLRDWWRRRSIPASRNGLADLLERLGIGDPGMLLTRSMGLSLSDQYWIRPSDADVGWEEVNFFDNPFSEDVGDLLFGRDVGEGEIDLGSPDNTSDGNLRKRWRIADGRRCLVKAGTGPNRQEPFNEVVASILMGAAGIGHVDYRLIWDGDEPCSLCEDFVDRDTELVSAYPIIMASDHDGSILDTFLHECSEHGLDARDDMDRMIAVDHIIANTDRHTNNFGIVRDAASLEWLRVAPIYDSGSSLGYDVPTQDIQSDAIRRCKPFADSFRKQIGLASSLESVDTEAMRAALPEALGVFGLSLKHMDPERVEAISALISDRISEVESRRDAMRTWSRSWDVGDPP